MEGQDRMFPRATEGNFGANWVDIVLPEGQIGMLVIARNTLNNQTRLYVYADSVWGHIEVTGD